MGDWGFDDFKTYLKFQLGQRTDLSAATDDSSNLYGIWVNLAYRELTTTVKLLGKEYNFFFPETEANSTATTTDGTNYISTPTDCLYVEDIFDETNIRWLEPIPHRQFVQYTDRADTSAEGDPVEWVRRGSYIYLHPTPGTTDDTLRIYYKDRVDNLVTTGATVIGAEWDEIILQLALLKALRWTNDYEALSTESNSLGALLDAQSTLYHREELGREPMVRPSVLWIQRGQGYKT